MIFGAVEFPPIENVIEWPAFLFEGSDYFAFNKIGLIYGLGFLLPTALFLIAARGDGLVPRGVRTVAEGIVEFIDVQVVQAAIGPDGRRYMPLLTSLFLFIFIGNITEVIPFFQMPGNARMAGPLVLALIVYVTWISVGIKHNGLGYIKEVLVPPGVPKALYLLVTPIEFLSNFLIRPFSHAVRLFANMLAGHILLVTFSVLCISVFSASLLFIVEPFTFAGLLAFTAFEVGVSLIQAFVFTILTAVYIGMALHPAH
ncbi:MAG: F0F1 ATP synthase subunit A [Acidimicrobiales bacterium]|nr:F0F1 ATP synthase subunit A [Acidimicrobiales bacterium]